MSRLLLWLSGVDRQLLAKCTRLPESEVLRFEGYGGLVLFPPTVGFIAMGYGVYTFVPNVPAAIATGTVWAAFVLWIERFLSMTMHKSTLRSVYHFWVGFAVRLLLAGVIGYGLSHPVTLLLFQGPIDQEMADQGRTRRREAYEVGEKIKTQAQESLNQARASALGQLPAELDRKQKLRDCTSVLVSMEQAGEAPGTFARDTDGNTCGVASGEEGCKAKCQSYLREREKLDGEIADIKKEMNKRRDTVDGDGIEKASEYARRLVEQIERESQPTDYSARTRALAAVESKHPEIKAVHIFLAIFLILLDTLVVTLKAITPEGEYEEARDTALVEARALGRAQRASATSWGVPNNTLTQSRLNHENQRVEIEALLQLVNEVVHGQTIQLQQFDAKFAALDDNVGKVLSSEDRDVFTARLFELRRVYHDAWGKTTERLRAYIRGL